MAEWHHRNPDSCWQDVSPPMIDCLDGLVVSWTIGTRPHSDLVNMSLDAAIERVARNAIKPVIHSDRGSHYRWPGWSSRVHNG